MPKASAARLVARDRISRAGTFGFASWKSFISRKRDKDPLLARLSVPKQTLIPAFFIFL
jgi:hypothetical protein